VTETFDSHLRLILDQLLSGELLFMEMVVVVSSAERDWLLYQTAKEVLRLGQGGTMPPLHLFVLMGHRYAASREYGLNQAAALARRARAISGRGATRESLAQAITVMNRYRRLLRQFVEVRRRSPAVVSGSEALQVIGAGRFMAPADYADVLERYLAGLRPDPALAACPRLLVMSSTPLAYQTLHQALESAGAVVVAEDDWWGARAVGPEIDLEGDLVEAIFDHYHRHTPNRAIYPATARLEWMYAEMVRPDIDGVVFYMPPTDRAMGWDYPRLRQFAESRGRPSLMLRQDVMAKAGREQIVEVTAAFIDGLRKGRAQS
jgi:benzoyl-CoA reductase/2-hydroxyglutaryl-CoA dehydratase subunit BcrC/BadD/HgdB